MSDYATKLAELINHLGCSQVEFAAAVGLDPTTVSKYMTRAKRPGTVACLLFAGISNTPFDKHFWLNLGKIDALRLKLISKAVAPDPAQNDYEAQLASRFLEFWRDPQGVIQPNIKEILRVTVFADVAKPE